MTIRERIDLRLDHLVELMNSNTHISNTEIVEEAIQNVSKFWIRLTEEEREYILAVRDAIEEQIIWK